MKKILLSALSVSILLAGYGQSLPVASVDYQIRANANDFQAPALRPVYNVDRAAGDTIWSNDFSVPADWTATGPSTDYTVNGWSIGTTTNGWYFGTTGNMGTTGNFARFVNGDPSLPGDVINNGPFTLEYNTAIDLTGVAAPSIQFSQYGARFITLQSVEVSTDGGTTWIEVGNNDDIAPLTANGGFVYGQPETRLYNIGSAIAGNPANVTFRFLWDGAQNGPNLNYIEYAWFVDDVQIIEGSNYDAKIEAGRFASDSLEYYMIPLSQIAPIQFSGEVSNIGDSTHTGLQLFTTVDMGSNVYSGSSQTINLAPNNLDTLETTSLFTPSSGLGVYEIIYSFAGNNPDDLISGNDTIIDSLEVTNATYARDNGIQNGGISNFAGNANLDFKIGNLMETYGNGYMNQLSMKITSNAGNAGQFIMGTVYELVNGIYTEVETTDLYQVTTADLDTFVTLQLMNSIPVQAGQTFLVCAGHFGGAGVTFGTAQPTYMGSVLGFNSGATVPSALLSPNAIMIRAIITESITLNQSVTICDGATYSIGNSTYSAGGIFTDSLLSVSTGSDSIVITTLSVAPVYNDTLPPTIICDGESFTFGGTAYNTPGFYTNTFQTVNFGCDSTVVLNLQVEQPIDAGVTVNQFTLSANLSGASYQWLDCDAGLQIIAGETSQDFSPSDNGNYAVIVTVNGCSDTSACEPIQGLSIEKVEQPVFSVYPNPAHDAINISIMNSVSDAYSVRILNNLGQTVRNSEVISKSEYQLNNLNLPSGIYFVELSSASNTHIEKLMIYK